MTDARAAIHALLPVLDSPAEAAARETELDRRLDTLTAEVRRTDAAHLLGERRHHIQRAIFCDGIKHAARLLEGWAGETAAHAERGKGGTRG